MSNSSKPTGDITNKGGKRKGSRSVSTLTPSQLSRKRANDREAQRAIRARTKEHIESLEREIEDLRSQQSRDQIVQNLLRKNRALEDELRRLRECMGIRHSDASEQYQSVFDHTSPRQTMGQPMAGYSMMQNIPSYDSMPDATGGWSTAVPCSISSTVSSPSSSGGTDDFAGGNYLSTSGSPTVFERGSLPPHARSPVISGENGDGGFDDVKPDFACHQINMMPLTSNYSYQPWNLYPTMQHYQAPMQLDHSHQMPQIARCQF